MSDSLKQLVESLIDRILLEVDPSESYRKLDDQSFDMSFEEWFASMGGMDKILSYYDINLEDTYYWLKGDLDDEDDEEAFEELALKEVQQELENSFYSWSSKWDQLEYPLTLYRCVSLDNIESLRLENIGIYWTHDRSSAECHWGYGKGADTFILVTEVGLEDIDQPATIEHNMHPDLGTTEQEITLKSGRSITITSIIGPRTGAEQDIILRGTT